VNDFLDEKRREISDRLKELQPAVEEFRRLEAAAAALQGVGGSVRARASAAGKAGKKGRRRGPGRPRATATKARATSATKTKTAAKRKPARRRAGRRKGSGTRAAEALKLVQGQPGITIPELAGKMGIKQNYLYRVLPGLESEGKVSKSGRGWHPRKGK
jgi:ribosomal protein S25